MSDGQIVLTLIGVTIGVCTLGGIIIAWLLAYSKKYRIKSFNGVENEGSEINEF